MATPTEVIKTVQIGQYGQTTFTATWGTTDNYADEVVVDLSGITTYVNTVSVRKLLIVASAGLGVLVEYNLGTDEAVGMVALGACTFERDFTKDCNGLETGLPQSSGAFNTGDIVVTTTSAASADELCIIVDWFAT